MENGGLNPFQENELKYLRRQVDTLQEVEHRRDAHPNAKQDLWVAREELDRFVRNLRAQGVNI
jgi:hypothetical protein